MPGAERGEWEEEEREEDDTEWLVRSPGGTSIVRKELAPAIRDLVHHGLGQGSSSLSVNPFSGCMSARGGAGAKGGILHAWDVVMKFYEMKGGAEYNSAPARRLSRSFGLDLAGSGTGNKQVSNEEYNYFEVNLKLFSGSSSNYRTDFILAAEEKSRCTF